MPTFCYGPDSWNRIEIIDRASEWISIIHYGCKAISGSGIRSALKLLHDVDSPLIEELFPVFVDNSQDSAAPMMPVAWYQDARHFVHLRHDKVSSTLQSPQREMS